MPMKRRFMSGILAALAVLTSTACDLLAPSGATLTLANRGAVFGSGGNAQTAPLPAVRVRSGATLVVQDADLFGGGTLVQTADQARFGTTGPGIFSDGGTLRVQQGAVRGGSIVLQAAVPGFDDPAPAIDASSSDVQISGGSIVGGSIVSSVPGVPATGTPGSAIEAFDSTLRITGGSLSAGALDPMPASTPANPGVALLATASDVEIRGGAFAGGNVFIDSRVRILGGSMSVLAFQSSDPAGCGEIRGGRFSSVGVAGGRVVVAGTGLALTSVGGNALLLTGTLESGDPVRAVVVQEFAGQVALVAPGSPGCP